MLAEFENETDRARREYAQLGADWAYFLVQFLSARRRTEIQPEEIVQTQLYLRANEAERRALDFVCEVYFASHPSPNDVLQLRLRDQFLMDYIDGAALGHSDWVHELKMIPAKVQERERADRAMFAQVWESPYLFSWIFR